jgi:hypothetical protein
MMQNNLFNFIGVICGWLVVFLSVAVVAQAQELTPPAVRDVPAGRGLIVPPEKKRPASIPRLQSPPVIDGRLDDAIWTSAAVFKEFY